MYNSEPVFFLQITKRNSCYTSPSSSASPLSPLSRLWPPDGTADARDVSARRGKWKPRKSRPCLAPHQVAQEASVPSVVPRTPSRSHQGAWRSSCSPQGHRSRRPCPSRRMIVVSPGLPLQRITIIITASNGWYLLWIFKTNQVIQSSW